MDFVIKNGWILLTACCLLNGCAGDKNNKNDLIHCLRCSLDTNHEYLPIGLEECGLRLEEYLIKRNILKNESLEAYLDLFQSSKYKLVNYDSFYDYMDILVFASPEQWATYVICSQQNQSDKWMFFSDKLINVQDLESYYSNDSRMVELLKDMTEEDFDIPEVKLFIQMLIYYKITHLEI